jgi:glycosyltransferase involved in cell wall biosynthesis
VAIVHHGFVPTYRVAFYERLAAVSEVEYVVFHGQAPRRTGHRAAAEPLSFPNVRVTNRELLSGERPVLLQPVGRKIATGGFAGAVVSPEFRLTGGYVAAAVIKAQRRALLLWGQGYVKPTDARGAWMRDIGARVKARIARLADGYLVYTQGGARQLEAAGVDADRITVVRNTLDITAHRVLHDELAGADEEGLRDELGLRRDSVVLLYIGRVYREKRIHELVELARRLAGRPELPPVETVVIGDGPELAAARDAAGDLPGVRFLGGVYEDAEVARWLRVAAAVIIPGAVGLAANHALAHGVPLLTRESDRHGPELEYLEHNRNALIVAGSFDAFVEAVAAFVSSSENRARLAAGALASREQLGLDHMVHAFDQGVRRALEKRSLL